jgi:hypothetical protein
MPPFGGRSLVRESGFVVTSQRSMLNTYIHPDINAFINKPVTRAYNLSPRYMPDI